MGSNMIPDPVPGVEGRGEVVTLPDYVSVGEGLSRHRGLEGGVGVFVVALDCPVP